jgi:glycine oxidase
MLLLRGVPGRLRQVVVRDRCYLIPRADGHVLVGSTMEEAGFDSGTTEEAREDLRAFATGLMPELGNLAVERHWAGLRPGSPEGVPFVGPVPGVAGLYLNTGHFRNGFATGPASARLVTDLLLGRAPSLDPAPYAPPAAAPGPDRAALVLDSV